MTNIALYIVEVNDNCVEQLAGHTGCSYASPPQPAVQALALVRVLLDCPQHPLDTTQTPWKRAIAGGQRTVRLHAATPAGQLSL